jgi:HAE1 family hydrophobic/amphiphilic exporter-1
MTRFALRFPYFIMVVCLMIGVIGVTSIVRMPVDLFPPIKIPVVVVATFFSGMPPEQIENDITGRFERFFTLASGIDHIESRSLPGVSLIKLYFQPGSDPDSAVSSISNLALADLRRLPPGTLPPVVLKFDASSLPVCLITLKGEGLTETVLRDFGQFAIRNQMATVPGASVPQPFGGKYRQIMVYVDPLKLEAHQLSVMDVVRTVNNSNLILPAGDVKIGPLDYNLYANSQIDTTQEIDQLPLKTIGNSSVLVQDVGSAKDGAQIQTNIVRVDGQRSVYLPVLKQGGDSNTIAIVDGIKRTAASLVDIPKNLITKVVFDQSIFVKNAIENLIHEGLIGLVLTGLMILLFLGSARATVGVFLSIPLSALATFIALMFGGSTINTMILGGLALVFSRLIDNSVVVIENIFRHIEEGESPSIASDKGGQEVAMPVLAATLTTAVVFFPVTFLSGVSKYLFSALALAVVIALFASYVVALSVVPLFCSYFIKDHDGSKHGKDPEAPARKPSWGKNISNHFNRAFATLLAGYSRMLKPCMEHPVLTLLSVLLLFAMSLIGTLWIGLSYFPRTDPAQFVVDVKAPSGTRLEESEKLVEKVETIIKQEVLPRDLDVVVSNLGLASGFSSMYSSNSGQHTAFVQCSLTTDHRIGSFEYMRRVRRRIRTELPQLTIYLQSGGLMDSVLNLGLPAPIDIQISGSNLKQTHELATEIAQESRTIEGVSDVYVPQDIDYPSIKLNVNRLRASELGLDSKEVIGNIITALVSNQMIAPSFWVDPHTGNDYMLTVQYAESQVKSLADLRAIPIRATGVAHSIRLDELCTIEHSHAPTEVDHYQLQRVIDVFVATDTEDLRGVMARVNSILSAHPPPEGARVHVRGMVQGMYTSFTSFGFGLILSIVLVYLVLVAQFRSFIDPVLILLAVPTGIMGVIGILVLSGTSLNVMSLMGVIMMVGIVVSNSILIVDFAHRLRGNGLTTFEAARQACMIRMRPVLMTSLATLIGLIPMALHLGVGGEAYAPLASAVIGGLGCSVVLTMFVVPTAYLLVYRHRAPPQARHDATSQLQTL